MGSPKMFLFAITFAIAFGIAVDFMNKWIVINFLCFNLLINWKAEFGFNYVNYWKMK